MKAKVKVELNSVELKALESARRIRRKLGYDKDAEFWQVAVVVTTANIRTGKVKNHSECHLEPGANRTDEIALDHMEMKALQDRVAFLEETLPKRMKELGIDEAEFGKPKDGQAAGTTH